MVVGFLLPRGQTNLLDTLHYTIADCPIVPALVNRGIHPWRKDWCGSVLEGREIGAIVIIATIGAHLPNRLFDVLEDGGQCGVVSSLTLSGNTGYNFLSRLVNGKMNFAPRSARGGSMLAHHPLTIAVDLESA